MGEKIIIADRSGIVYIRGPRGGLTRVGWIATRFDINHRHEPGDVLCTSRQLRIIQRAFGQLELSHTEVEKPPTMEDAYSTEEPPEVEKP